MNQADQKKIDDCGILRMEKGASKYQHIDNYQAFDDGFLLSNEEFIQMIQGTIKHLALTIYGGHKIEKQIKYFNLDNLRKQIIAENSNINITPKRNKQGTFFVINGLQPMFSIFPNLTF